MIIEDALGDSLRDSVRSVSTAHTTLPGELAISSTTEESRAYVTENIPLKPCNIIQRAFSARVATISSRISFPCEVDSGKITRFPHFLMRHFQATCPQNLP